MDGISGLSAPSGALCVDFPTCKDGAAEGWPWFHIRVYRAGKACLHAGPVPRQEQLAAADSCKPLALINRDCCQQDEGWDAGRAVIGLGLRMEGGIWCCCAPPCNIWRGSSFEVGTQWPSRSEPSLSIQHVFHPCGQGLRFPSSKSPLWGFFHQGGGEWQHMLSLGCCNGVDPVNRRNSQRCGIRKNLPGGAGSWSDSRAAATALSFCFT